MTRLRIPIPGAAEPDAAELGAMRRDGWAWACATHDVPGVMPRAVEVGGRTLLICRRGDDYVAVDELCPHKQQSMRMGFVIGDELLCPHHMYRFDLRTGAANVRRCPPLTTFETRVAGDGVWVRVFEPGTGAEGGDHT
jgi:nitrite reductase/ring-hydroxylating ferredoxin subunit